MMNNKKRAKELYYITHIKNLRSILQRGILSHSAIDKKDDLEPEKIYDGNIVSNREIRQAPDGRSLWDFANVYFQPRNPMMYRVIHERNPNEIAVVGLKPSLLDFPGAFITDGNAASGDTEFYAPDEGKKVISKMWKTIDSEWWNPVDGSKRKIMAECLIPEKIPSSYIDTICVRTHQVAQKLKDEFSIQDIAIVPEPKIFFLPSKQYGITDTLTLAEGDLFFSKMQTLTVSVNTVGVMGKGLASRAKYQFPDVYVTYQDACRSKKLQMGKPYLYKREASFDEELTELTDTSRANSAPNDVKWFLLFPTKHHWRENSDIEGIEQGLGWIAKNYKTEGIKSLALPALGCGLGKLEWKDVGPLMCKYLSSLDIHVVIYLPREKEIDTEFLRRKYLLNHK